MSSSEEHGTLGRATGASTPPEGGQHRRSSDLVSRSIGMAFGVAAGALLMILLVVHGGIDFRWVAWFPGAGVALGCGVFSFRRSRSWGLAAALLGIVAMVLVLWLRSPFRFGIVEVAQRLAMDLRGCAGAVLVGVQGILVGAGWEKRRLFDSEDPSTPAAPSAGRAATRRRGP